MSTAPHAPDRQWLVQSIPLMDGQVAHLGVWWPLTRDEIALLQCGIAVNLALAEFSTRLKAEQAG